MTDSEMQMIDTLLDALAILVLQSGVVLLVLSLLPSQRL